MKEFDIELAKQGKPVCTRDGRPVRIICWDCKGEDPIIGLVEHNGVECPLFCKGDGKVRGGEEFKVLDLMMASEKHEGWVNVRIAGDYYIANGTIYNSKEEAERECGCGRGYVTTIKIEWEE